MKKKVENGLILVKKNIDKGVQKYKETYPVIVDKTQKAVTKYRDFWSIEDDEHYMTLYVRILSWFLIIFFLWATFAPINSYVISSGNIILSGSKKSISHLEGGVVEEINVKEGQFVTKGQKMIVLSQIQAESRADSTRKHLVSSMVNKIRLSIEMDGKKDLDLSEVQNAFDLDEDEKKILQTQLQLFDSRKQNREEKLQILKQKIAQTKQEINAANSQKEAVKMTISALQEEAKIIDELFEEGGVSLTRKLDVDKKIAESKGKLGEIEANVARLKSVISQNKLEIINFQSEEQKSILKELHENEIAMSDFENEYQTTSDILGRTSIRAPVDGFVMDFLYQTKGSVIPPATQIMYIVPKDDVLVAEVKIKPQDIDLIFQGMEAKIQLSAYKARIMPKLTGRVIFVSADSFKDEATQEIYFKARIEIPDSEIAKLKADVKLIPGMPVDGFIITGSRSLLNYLLSPIRDSAFRAFREE